MKKKKRKVKGNSLLESIVGVGLIFVPLVLCATDLTFMFHAAHVNEEFAEQLARLCSTLKDKANAEKACLDVIKQYQLPSCYANLELKDLVFDLSAQEVSLTTKMVVTMPVPFPGYERITVSANAKQPIVSIPVPQ